ncbi:MAG: thiamine phosphate synthase [Phycisphaerales bacterium]|nr:thiamine phosphate synthase [Phycisphaerales bacterium]
MSSSQRMADAAFNRAREGLRVMEDLARFILDDQDLVASLKQIRHELTSISIDWPGLSLVLSRDTAGDVGTSITTEGESKRSCLRDVAAAAGRRSTEALRSLEELAKVDIPNRSSTIEQMRYRLYDLAGSVERSLPSARSTQWNLCVLITEAICLHDWREVARAAVAGGADCLQLREKSHDVGELVDRSRELISIARPHGVDVIINDRADVAVAAHADGVHVGSEDLPVADVRAVVGDRMHVGATVRNVQAMHRAIENGASYVGIGPMYQTGTKPHLESADSSVINELMNHLYGTPHLVIGGINSSNITETLSTGARGVAVCNDVCASDDPEQATRSLVHSIQSQLSQTLDHA